MNEARASLSAVRETEHKVESDSGWFINRETGATTSWEGVRILWRFKGERLWRRKVIVPDVDQGQTVTELRRIAPEIVKVLAEAATDA